MDKRYQVFTSSTYADLKNVRQKITRTLMEMDCIPAGMELFPAADEEQWEFIKRVIDDCDYYLLIIGGRYGSTTAEGVSYTEKEYDYAVEKSLPIIALVHEDPEEAAGAEHDPEAQARLRQFRDKVITGRMVKMWRAPEDLPGHVAVSVQRAIKANPTVGWVRGDAVASESLLAELNDVRKESERLRLTVAKYKQQNVVKIPDLAGLDEVVKITGKHHLYDYTCPWEIPITWGQLFALVAPLLLTQPNDYRVRLMLCSAVYGTKDLGGRSVTLDDQVFQTVKIQLSALKLVNIQRLNTTGGGVDLFWSLTERGEALMMETRTIRSGT